MNYLAHIYLSNEIPLIKLGNFLGDFIKGNRYKNYPEEIQKGVLLHRQIDHFTDNHTVFRKSKRRLHERYGHYDGIIIDIIYDHFLSKNWEEHSAIPLEDYAQDFYDLMHENFDMLPSKAQKILPVFSEQNWLLSYPTLDGIQKVFDGMNRRTKGLSQMNLAVGDLKENYSELEDDFNEFFAELKVFSLEVLEELS